MSNIATLQQDIWAVQEQFAAVAVVPTVNFEREAGFAVQLLQSNDYLAKVAYSNRQSLVNAVTNISALGVTLNPAKKQAYLVPRDGKICLDISYMGLIDLAVECGSILWAQANLVYETESLQLNGFKDPPTHTRNPFAKNKGEVVGAYCVARLTSGDYLTEAMSIEELHAIRDRTSGWKKWLAEQKKSPWVTDPGEMCRKTVVKRAAKYWPRVNGERLTAAIHHLNVEGEEGLAELAQPPAIAGPATSALAEWTSKAEAAQSVEGLQTVAREGAKHFRGKNDVEAYRAFAAAVQARGAVLRAAEANTIGDQK